MNLSIEQLKELIAKAEFAFRREECATCECYLGYVTQLKIDTGQEGRKYLKKHFPPPDEVHACLGCDPCSPSTLYADYLRKKTTGTIVLNPKT